MIDVLVVAPGAALRAGLRAILESDERVQVVGEAARLSDLAEHLPTPDVLLVAGAVFTRAGLADLLAEAEPAPAVLLLAEDARLAAELPGLPLRAWGVLHTEASAEELLAAVHSLQQGLVAATPALLQTLLGPAGRVVTGEPLVEDLTRRELDVLENLADGLANKQIALALGISEHTVKFHIASVYTKLAVGNRAEAVRTAARLGLISL